MARERRVAIALVDGEHYPPVVAAAIAGLRERFEVRAVVMLGGSEKLRTAPAAADYGVAALRPAGAGPFAGLGALVAEFGADLVVDLSDEPVVSQRTRLRLAAAALHAEAGYVAAGLTLEPPVEVDYPHPSIAVVGTGKRVGKTAVAGQLARIAQRILAPREVVVVAMGRGGPGEPELIERGQGTIDALALLERSRGGAHAASDFLEDAVLAGVTTIGCRRCGGGLAGDVVFGNVAAGAAIASARAPALTIFEGSGASRPPVQTSRTLLVTSAAAPVEELLGYLGPYRLLRADAVLIVGDQPCDPLIRGIGELRPELEIERCTLVPRPARAIGGRRAAVFTTAQPRLHDRIVMALRERHGVDVVHVSGALADRGRLRDELATIDAEVFLTELKAAAIDVVAEAAVARGVDVVFLDNEPVALDGSDRLDRLLGRQVREI